MSTQTEDAVAVDVPQPKRFSLKILHTIKVAQMQNGLRHSDYSRYRAYCTRRLRRIRKSLKFLHGHRFHKKNIDPAYVKNPRFIELALMYAERSWAQAMALKEITDNYRNKFVSTRRLAKAAKWGKLLLAICNQVADDRTKLEAESYSSWLSGSVLIENENWKEARELLIKAKTVYEELGKVGNMEEQELCRERVNEIEPTIRYCNFSLSQEGQNQDHDQLVKMITEADTNLKSKLDNVLADIRKKEAQSMNEITWKAQRVPIRGETLKLAVLSVNDVIYEIEQATTLEQKLQFYSKLFMHYDDAQKAVQAEVNSNKGQKKQTEQETILEYLTFQKLKSIMQRNLMLVEDVENRLNNPGQNQGKVPKADEAVRLYELLIENTTELLSHLDSEQDENMRKEYAAKLLSFKALRCLYLGYSYASAGKYPEAVVLYKKSKNEIQAAISHHQECNNADTQLVSKLTDADKKAAGQQSYVQAQSFLESIKDNTDKTEQTNEKKDARGGLLDNINEYNASFIDEGKVIDFPPKFEPIPCKPLLFDLALQSTSFPDLEEKKKAPRSGFFGFWSR